MIFLPIINKTSIHEEIILIILIYFLTKNSMRGRFFMPFLKAFVNTTKKCGMNLSPRTSSNGC